MLKKPLLAASALMGPLFAMNAAPAQAAAAPLAISVPSAMPLATIGLTHIGCGPARTAPAITAPPRSRYMSKSAAILGGQPSALERLKMQQAGQIQPAANSYTQAASLAPALPVAGSAAAPVAAIGIACASTARPATTIAGPAIMDVSPRAVTGTFMGTERVKIGRTRFDAKWDRVADRELSSRDLTNALGAVPADRDALLAKVNRWVNRSITYRDDRGGDRWADAKETLSKRAGDCEDYAILKLQLLHAAGVAKDDLMLTLARDNMAGNDHAVLLVRNHGASGEEWVMLDMGSDRVVPAAGDYGYRPVMSFAGDTRYLHGKKYNPNARRTTVRFAMGG